VTDFEAKMHQIRFWLGLCQHSPDSLAGFKGPTSIGREGRGGEEGKGKGGRKGRGMSIFFPEPTWQP